MRLALACLVVLAGCDTVLGAPRDGSDLDAGRPDPRAADAPLDAGTADASIPSPDAPAVSPTGRVLYPEGAAHSPITDDLAGELRALASAAGRDPHVLSRVGDSITVSSSFLDCFAGTRVLLDGRDVLSATIDHINDGSVGGANPFTRDSLAATVGWSASAPLAGSPSPLAQELSAAHPGYASLMFGTNDVGFRDPGAYAANMLDLVDAMLDVGAIPLMSTIPPRDDSASAEARVPLFNAIVRGIAQGRGVPLVDLYRAMLALPDHGLGGDDLHPNVAATGGCDFTATGLEHGYNQRNLLVIGALDRARRAVAGEPAPDGEVERMVGEGTLASPFEVVGTTFTDLRDTAEIGASSFERYGCSAANEGGPEVLYRVTLASAATIHAWVFDRGSVDVDVHLLDASGSPAGCLSRDDVEIRHAAGPGTYYLSVDSFVDGGGTIRSGEYLLVVMVE